MGDREALTILKRLFHVGDRVCARVKAVRLDNREDVMYDLEIPPRTIQVAIGAHLVDAMRRGFAREAMTRPGVDVRVTDEPAVEPSGLDQEVVERAAELARQLDQLTAVQLTIPHGKLGLVIGRQGATIKELAGLPGIRHLATEGDQFVVAIADDAATLDDLVSRIATLIAAAAGTLLVPEGKNGLLIGRQGMTINELKARAGIHDARSVNRSRTWKVTASTAEAVQAFAQLAQARVPGTTLTELTVTEVESVRRLR